MKIILCSIVLLSSMGACNSKSSDNAKKHEAPVEISRLSESPLIKIHDGSILGIASHGNIIASCSDDKTVAISDRQFLQGDQKSHSYSPLHLKGHEKAVNRVHFDSNSSILYSASRDLSLRLVIFIF